jgi:hypothetical protein
MAQSPPGIPETVDALQKLVLTQRRQYGEALTKVAMHARHMGAYDTALFAEQMRAFYGLEETAAGKRVQPVQPVPPLQPPIRARDEANGKVTEYEKRIIAALRKVGHALTKSGVARHVFGMGERADWNHFEQAMTSLRTRGILEKLGSGAGSTYFFTSAHASEAS